MLVIVSQALAEVHGFGWWDTLAPNKINSKVQNKHQEGTSLYPLECTQFDDLITIITAEVSDWSEDKQLSINDLLELLSSSESITEIKTNLEHKIKKVSFWDVFSRYFEDTTKWGKIKKCINFVIIERHKVMHHRPIRYGVLQALLNKKEEIFTFLDSAKPELSEQERSEAQEEVKDIRETIIQRSKKSGLMSNSELSSTIQGLRESLISSSELSSTIQGLGKSLISSSELSSTIQGLRESLISSSELSSTIQGLRESLISSSELLSTIQGLGKSSLIPNAQLLDKLQMKADSGGDKEEVIESEINDLEGEK